MKKKILITALSALLLLASCSNESSESSSSSSSGGEASNPEDCQLTTMTSLLEGTLLTNEINLSSKVVSKEVTTKDVVSEETDTETWNIYNNETSFATGSKTISYASGTTITDTYKKLAQASTPYGTKLFFLVTDYEDGKKRSDWTDSANSLEITETAESTDGYSTLSKDSVPYQLSKQVAYIASNWIKSNLTNNTNTMSTYPMGHKKTIDGFTTYYIDSFSYSYTSEGTVTTIKNEFSFTVNSDNLLTSFKSFYSMSDEQDGETYTQELVNEYSIEYAERAASPAQSEMLDPTQYFLGYVMSVEAVYNKNNKEVVTDIDKLPSNTWVTFRAKSYAPSKAVDIRLYPNGGSAATSNSNVISIDSNTYFHTENAGTATLSLIGLYGAKATAVVTVLPPEIESLSYNDINSGIEKEGTYSSPTRYVYSNTTYSNINIYLNPADVDASDIVATVNDSNLVSVSVKTTGNGYIEYQYDVLDVNDGDTFTVTFASKTKPAVSISVTYKCKIKVPVDQVATYLVAHTYTATSKNDAMWNSYNPGTTAILTFLTSTTGKIVYHWVGKNSSGAEVKWDEEVLFSYVLTDYKATVTITSSDPTYEFDSFELTKDLKKVSFSIPEEATYSYRTVTFYIDEN